MLVTRLKNATFQIIAPQGFSKLDSVLVPLAIMIIGAGLNFLMLILIARVLPTGRFSNFAFWFSILSMLAGIGIAGQGALIFKNWSCFVHRKDYGLARGALVFGAFVSCAGATIIGITVGLFQFVENEPPELIVSSTLFVFLLTLLYFVSPLTRAISGFVAGDSNMEITWRLIAVVLIASMAISGFVFSVESIFLILSAGAFVSLVLCLLSVTRNLPQKLVHARTKLDITDWRKRSFRIAISDVIENISLHLDVVVIGLFVDPLLAGGYFVATRIANIFSRLTAAFANYASRRIAPLHFAGRHEELRKSMRDLALMALLLAGGGLFGLIVSAQWILSLFGAQYVSEIWVLLVLAAGALTTTLAGPAPDMLLHTGHDNRYLQLLLAGLALRCILFLLLLPFLGTMGAAIASTIEAVFLAILLVRSCRRLVGIDPSVLALFDRKHVANA